MDSTHDFVKKVKDTQNKQAQNSAHQGKGNPGRKLPGQQHSTDK